MRACGQILAKTKPLAAEARSAPLEQMRALARDELEVACKTLELARQDSRIGYDASNQYYVPLDLVERAINCRGLLDHALAGQ